MLLNVYVLYQSTTVLSFPAEFWRFDNKKGKKNPSQILDHIKRYVCVHVWSPPAVTVLLSEFIYIINYVCDTLIAGDLVQKKNEGQ